MAIRLSDAAAALMAGDVGLRRALADAHMVFYTGTQPSSANSGIGTAQPIVAFTLDDSVMTEETLATWEIVFSGLTGTAGLSALTLDNIEILGATVTNTALGTIADDVATQINSFIGNAGVTAVSDSVDTVTVTAPKGSGAFWNSAVIAGTESGTVTCTETGGGAVVVTGVTAVNGLTFDVAADGADLVPAESNFYIAKPAGVTWKGKNGFGPADAVATAVFTGITDGNSYTAGWGRICASPGDDGSGATADANGYIRLDFSIGTSSEDFVISPSASLTVNTTGGSEIESVINSFKLKVAKQPAV
jgi:hypothetical protein